MFESISNRNSTGWRFRLVGTALFLGLFAGLLWIVRMTSMTLNSYSCPLPPRSGAESELEGRLSSEVKYLSETVGERNMSRVGSLETVVNHLRRYLQQAGYAVTERPYQVDGREVNNLEVILNGTESAGETVV